MKASEILTEGRNVPCIVVDIQPSYTGIYDGDELPWIDELMQFINQQNSKILMFVNAEDQGLTTDTIQDIKVYWEDSGFDPINWNRVEIVDKGFGFFRNWMDSDIPKWFIIRTIREMYQFKHSDSGIMFETGQYSQEYRAILNKFLEDHYDEFDEIIMEDSISIEWTSVAQLKRFSGSYIMGGGRHECLREVQLLMNAFNIKYKTIDNFVYG